MLGLTTLVATLLRSRAQACVVLAYVAALLCVASTASANSSAQTKTRVWVIAREGAAHVLTDKPRSHSVSGTISRVYSSGHGDWPEFEVDSGSEKHAGREWEISRFTNPAVR